MSDDAQPLQSAADETHAVPGAKQSVPPTLETGPATTSASDGRAGNSLSDAPRDRYARDANAGDSGVSESDVTVLAATTALEAEEFPQGLSPRELALTLKGQRLGHFHLQEFIGGGGMGAVFKALDTTLDRIVAVKVVASQSVSSEELQRRFLIEAQSTARLDHPNIARIHFVGRDRGLPYIVFEYIEGVNLRDLVVNHGPIPLGDALSFTSQIAHALAHAWQKEVVHRDIKPSNILVTREGQVKLVDMGLARLHQVDAVEHDLTNTGVTLGTFDYISPEQARDPREADTRSDIYSLGCTLFYMLAGRAPFANGTAVQKLLQHQDQTPPNLSELRPDVPESLAQLVGRMLAKSPDQRPQTPGELVAACRDILLELGLQPPQPLAPLPLSTAEVVAPAWRTHLPWVLPLIALLTIGGGWMAQGWGPSERVSFPPLRSAAPERVRVEAPEAASSVTPGNLTDSVSDFSQRELQANGAEAISSISVDALLDFAMPSTRRTGESSLLDFPLGEPTQPEGAASELEETLDFGSILLFSD